MKGYKVFEPDWTCRGFQYAVGETFEEDVTPSCCNRGFHFCTELKDCFSYYSFNPDNKVAEIEALGEIDTEGGSKHCTNKIRIVREISWEEVLKMVNTGKHNKGFCNSGDANSGNYNTGNNNGGRYNSGCSNSGNFNTGNCNSGSYNSGFSNSGYYNSGDYNSGYYNGGSFNSGNYNSGRFNSGNLNCGNYNSGNNNSGDYNSYNRNSGDYNSGYCNSGNYNSGKYNSGDWNYGNYNSGNYNNGYCNCGDWNNTNFSSGCFNTEEAKILLFNKPSNWTFRDWWASGARRVLSRMPRNTLEWIRASNMTDEEEERHPEYKTTGGYLKKIDDSKNSQIWWDNLPEQEKAIVKSIPNFDPDIFKKCTGIDVNKN